MAVVELTIGKKLFQLECPEGESAKIRSLAVELDKRFGLMAKNFGDSSDKTLLMMTALTMQDEINELKTREQSVPVQANQNHPSSSMENESLRKTMDSFSAICDYIENIAEKIEKS